MVQTDKLIICVAPTGSGITRAMNPYIPIQPAEIAEEVYRSWNAGATIAHIHARDASGKATTNPECFREIDLRIREKGCDIILQHSTSPGREPGASVNDWARCLEGSPEMATVDVGVAVLMRDGGEVLNLWTRSASERILAAALERNIKPELEIYAPGGIEELIALSETGFIRRPIWINFVLGMQKSLQNVVRFSPRNLMHYVDLLPSDSMFSAMSVGDTELPAVIQSILLGGHARVGFEDNVWYRKGVLAKSNAQLVERVALLGRELGREPASAEETRDLLGIPKNDSLEPDT